MYCFVATHIPIDISKPLLRATARCLTGRAITHWETQPEETFCKFVKIRFKDVPPEEALDRVAEAISPMIEAAPPFTLNFRDFYMDPDRAFGIRAFKDAGTLTYEQLSLVMVQTIKELHLPRVVVIKGYDAPKITLGKLYRGCTLPNVQLKTPYPITISGIDLLQVTVDYKLDPSHKFALSPVAA